MELKGVPESQPSEKRKHLKPCSLDLTARDWGICKVFCDNTVLGMFGGFVELWKTRRLTAHLGCQGMWQTCEIIGYALQTGSKCFLLWARGSIYTTIMELAPKRPSPLWFWGPNSIIIVYMDPLGSFSGQSNRPDLG